MMVATGNSCETQRPTCPAGERLATTHFYYGLGVHPPELPPPGRSFSVRGSNFTRNTDVTIRFLNYPSGDGDPFERYAHSDANGDVEWQAPIPPDGSSLPAIRPNDEREHVNVQLILRDSAGCIATASADSFDFNRLF
jgi:hypothetical protein